MKGSLGDKARLQHIYDAIVELESYVKYESFDSFQSNSMMQRACVTLLEIIGEASNHISEALKEVYNEIEWREIIGLRNLLIHQYFAIDTKIVWDIVHNDIPSLKSKVKEVLKQV